MNTAVTILETLKTQTAYIFVVLIQLIRNNKRKDLISVILFYNVFRFLTRRGIIEHLKPRELNYL